MSDFSVNNITQQYRNSADIPLAQPYSYDSVTAEVKKQLLTTTCNYENLNDIGKFCIYFLIPVTCWVCVFLFTAGVSLSLQYAFASPLNDKKISDKIWESKTAVSNGPDDTDVDEYRGLKADDTLRKQMARDIDLVRNDMLLTTVASKEAKEAIIQQRYNNFVDTQKDLVYIELCGERCILEESKPTFIEKCSVQEDEEFRYCLVKNNIKPDTGELSAFKTEFKQQTEVDQEKRKSEFLVLLILPPILIIFMLFLRKIVMTRLQKPPIEAPLLAKV